MNLHYTAQAYFFSCLALTEEMTFDKELFYPNNHKKRKEQGLLLFLLPLPLVTLQTTDIT